jgi:signal transduction histidine kinase
VRLFDLSLRHKIPLWGGVLIVVSTLATSAVLLARAYADLRQDLFTSSTALGQTLAQTLFPVLLHDDLWRAFEIVSAPLAVQARANPLEAETIFVVAPGGEVLAASDPRRLPTLGALADAGDDPRRLAEALAESDRETARRVFDLPGSPYYHVATPIEAEGRRLGTLVISHDRGKLRARFVDLAGRSALMGAAVLAIILPINWYWGRRTAEPLVELADGMGALVQGAPPRIPPNLYTYRDELGQLFEAYRNTARALHDKALLEQEMVRSERLAAVGRLAAGIAHEVNNPVGGMLIALDNLRQRAELDPSVARTAALLERGLHHIGDTVAALLVEARVSSRLLGPGDFDDVRTLVEPQLRKKQVRLQWQVQVPGELDLPAASVRQVLINLMLNAVQAVPVEGAIRVHVEHEGAELRVRVANTGEALPPHVREHLFEPFVSGREGGHGLGLWVSWLTVSQLGGQIAACNEPGWVCFRFSLPVKAVAACNPESA